MSGHLVGKTALVTGVTSGIGFQTALGLARDGADVILGGRDEDRIGDQEFEPRPCRVCLAGIPEGNESIKWRTDLAALGELS